MNRSLTLLWLAAALGSSALASSTAPVDLGKNLDILDADGNPKS